MKQRIVCSAILFEFVFQYDEPNTETLIVTGVRHYDQLMQDQIAAIDEFMWSKKTSEIQGFVDNKGKFLNREQAFIVAREAYQIIRSCGNTDGKELFSENLY